MTRRSRALAGAIGAVLISALPALAARPAPQRGYLAARDGTSLSYVLSLPEGAGPWPVLFTYDGYSAGGVEDPGYANQFVNAGYALVGVSVRGTGCSAGKFDFFEPVEADDGVDVIKWIASAGNASWSNGKVGMIGKSYAGITQLFTAEHCADDPVCSDHLVAIAPGHHYGDAYRDVAYPGGILNYGFATLWSFLSQPVPGEEDALKRIAAGGSDGTQCAVNRLGHLQNIAFNPLVQALQHPFDDALFRERSTIYDALKIKMPVYMANAWQDEQLGPRSTYLTEKLTAPYRQLLGNGSHGLYRYSRNLGALQVWFDHYLKGVANGIEAEPPVRVWFDTTSTSDASDGWHLDFARWPLRDSEVTPLTLYLHAGKKLTKTPPAVELPDFYLYPGGTQSRTGEDINGIGMIPTNVHDFKNDFYSIPPLPLLSVTYVTDPLAADTIVLGTIRATLFVATTAPDTDFQVSVAEVRPNGDVEYVQKGWLRASHRKLVTDPADPNFSSSQYRPVHTHRIQDAQLAVPGRVFQIDLEIPPVGHAFRKGERIRIDAEMPSILPELWGFLVLPIPAVNLVYHDAAHPSRILLPTQPVSLNPYPSPLQPEPACGARIRQPCRKAS